MDNSTAKYHLEQLQTVVGLALETVDDDTETSVRLVNVAHRIIDGIWNPDSNTWPTNGESLVQEVLLGNPIGTVIHTDTIPWTGGGHGQ